MVVLLISKPQEWMTALGGCVALEAGGKCGSDNTPEQATVATECAELPELSN